MHNFEPLAKPFEMLRPKLLIEKVGVLSSVKFTHGFVFRVVPNKREAEGIFDCVFLFFLQSSKIFSGHVVLI